MWKHPCRKFIGDSTFSAQKLKIVECPRNMDTCLYIKIYVDTQLLLKIYHSRNKEHLNYYVQNRIIKLYLLQAMFGPQMMPHLSRRPRS